jgi:hypothetical protein
MGRLEVGKVLLEAGADTTATGMVSERSVGDGGLLILMRRDFGES